MYFHSWRAKGEKRELGLREDQGFGGRSSHLWFPSDQEEEERLGVEESRDSKVRNQTLTSFLLCLGWGKPQMWIKVFYIGCKWVLVLVWIGLEECL